MRTPLVSTPPDILAESAPKRWNSVLLGFLLGVACLIAAATLFALFSFEAIAEGLLVVTLLPGLLPWIYLIPLAIYLKRQGLTATLKGLLLAGGVIFLLNASCFGLLLLFPPSFH